MIFGKEKLRAAHDQKRRTPIDISRPLYARIDLCVFGVSNFNAMTENAEAVSEDSGSTIGSTRLYKCLQNSSSKLSHDRHGVIFICGETDFFAYNNDRGAPWSRFESRQHLEGNYWHALFTFKSTCLK